MQAASNGPPSGGGPTEDAVRRRVRATSGRLRSALIALASASAVAAVTLAASEVSAQNWTGNTSTDWTDAGNWTGGVPTNPAALVNIDKMAPNPTVLGVGGAAVGTSGPLTIGEFGAGTGAISRRPAGTPTP